MFRRYYEGDRVMRLGYDFYADIAERIVGRRKQAGMTQGQLADKTRIPKDRISGYEQVKVRFLLDDLERISVALGTTTDILIGAEYDDPDCSECLYEVWNERFEQEGEKLSLLFKASSPQMAFLKAHKWSVAVRKLWFEARDRARVKLIAVPVRKADYANLKKRGTGYSDEIAPD